VTGEILLGLCESRLDNTVYRLGLAASRTGARQLVGHSHITVNGQVVNIPSFTLRAGDRVAVRERSKSLPTVTMALANRKRYDWLDWNDAEKQGVFLNMPERAQIPENIREQLIVELYSK
jgi:small subunit ribosomal protein S4